MVHTVNELEQRIDFPSVNHAEFASLSLSFALSALHISTGLGTCKFSLLKIGRISDSIFGYWKVKGAQNRDRWRALVNAVMNLWVP
jgi:hypothetical protein